jgi:hypothetical protein
MASVLFVAVICYFKAHPEGFPPVALGEFRAQVANIPRDRVSMEVFTISHFSSMDFPFVLVFENPLFMLEMTPPELAMIPGWR